ncbi:hypothetical protein BDV12DRAFT_201177 [Aspergillus spectabilis]
MFVLATKVASGNMTLVNRDLVSALCYHFESRPDLEFLNGRDTAQWCSTSIRPYCPDPVIFEKINSLCILALSQLYNNIPAPEPSAEAAHLRKYLEWMRLNLAKTKATGLERLPMKHAQFPTLLEDIQQSGAEGNLVSQVASNLTRFFSGEVTAVEFLLKDNAIENMYAHGLGITSVFEQTARTGSATACILDALVNHNGKRSNIVHFSKYCFTDVSPLFLEQGRKKFSNLVEIAPISFSLFGLEKPALQQGLNAGTYDRVIAFSVIHATSSIHQPLANCRKVLKPGGKFVLIEFTGSDLMQLEFVFGLFPGWWLAMEEHRRMTTLMSEQYWDAYLKGAALYPNSNFKGHGQALSAMISTAVEEKLKCSLNEELVILRTYKGEPELCELGRFNDRALKLDFKSPTLLNTVQFVEDPLLQQPLKASEVEVAIHYGGINFKGLLAALRHVDTTTLGLEGAGLVTRAGKESEFVPGDHVFGLFSGTLHRYSRCDVSLVRRLPESLDMTTAAALPSIFCTAYHNKIKYDG